MCEYPASPVVRNPDKESHFSLVPSRILNHELHELVGGGGGDWGAIDRMLRGIKGMQILLTALQTP